MSRTSKRNRKRHRRQRRSRRYYLTPKAWNRRCSHCGSRGAIAFRYPKTYACEGCIKERRIKPIESKAWIDGGSKSDSTVRIRHLDQAEEAGTIPIVPT